MFGRRRNELEINDVAEAIEEGEFVGEGKSVLDYFEQYPKEYLRKEFQELGNMALAPALLLGIADGPDVAEILNLLEAQRLHYKAVPEVVKGDSYMLFDLFVAVAKPIVSVAKYGRLLQAETRFKFEQEIPSWMLSLMLKQKEQEMLQAQQQGGSEQ